VILFLQFQAMGKSTLFDKFCAGDIDRYMKIFLDLQATKDTWIRSGIAFLKYIYNALSTTLGEIQYNMFNCKAAKD